MPLLSSALGRSLAILQAASLADRPLRYSDLKASTPGISDSTFSRLLRSLERSGYLVHVPEAGYAPGPGIRRWTDAIRQSPRDFSDIAAETVDVLTAATQESAALALLEDSTIRIVESRTMPDAVSVVRKDGILHFEDDHAASLAILHQLPPDRRTALLTTRHSRIRTTTRYVSGVKAALRAEGFWLDQSRARPGICRMALPFQRHGKPGAVFFCLTLVSAQQRKDVLLRELRVAQAALQKFKGAL